MVSQGTNSVAIFRIHSIDGTLITQAPVGIGPSLPGIVTVPESSKHNLPPRASVTSSHAMYTT